MQAIQTFLVSLQLHPLADHFTIAILTVAILSDLAARLAPQRLWIRKMALTLTIIGAAAAAASFLTGDAETDRVWDMLSPAAKDFFGPKGSIAKYFGHGALGYELMIAFGVLALWRILIGAFSFMEATHSIYLLFALVALGFLLYQGKTGAELVYKYQVGTGPEEPGPVNPAAAGAFSASPEGTPGSTATLGTASTPSLASPAINSTPINPSPLAVAAPTALMTGVPSVLPTPAFTYTPGSGNSLTVNPSATSTASP
ncbi:MAG TPA: DUF2231 domain-containing protein [Candidatus Binataceae bacterium]|jgi:uncharacterized membrane protein